MNNYCVQCCMACEPGEYHPYAACLMYKACLNAETVRVNLDAVLEHGRRKGQRESALSASEYDDVVKTCF